MLMDAYYVNFFLPYEEGIDEDDDTPVLIRCPHCGKFSSSNRWPELEGGCESCGGGHVQTQCPECYDFLDSLYDSLEIVYE
jgi:tRNA G26 N,N-dimethylase Trm1